MKRFFVKALAVLLVCMFVISGINFSIFASDGAADLGDKLSAVNVAISGQVKMLFYFTNVDGVDYYEVKVGENVTRTRVANMSTGKKDGKIRYLLEVPLAAAQQADEIIITPYTDGGEAGKVRTYCVRDYADKIFALDAESSNDTYTSLAKALKSMLNYGAMAQLAFSYNTSSLANNGLYYGATNPVNNLPVDALHGVKDYEYKTTDASKLSIKMASAYLEDVVSIKCYITYTGDVNDLSVSVEGHEDKVYQDKNGYYVKINDIPATKFNYQYAIAITDGTNAVTMKYSVLNFVQGMMEKNEDAEDVNAARAMYQFYVWLSEYAGVSAAVESADCAHDRSYVVPGTYAEICSDCGKDITPRDLLENSANLSNKVNAYYGTIGANGNPVVDPYRGNFTVTNSHLKFEYPLSKDVNQLATITNTAGNVYVQDTMDVYVKTASGIYYASQSYKKAEANIYRYGYYYYDAHMYGQNFTDGDRNVIDTANYAVSNFDGVNEVTKNSTGKYTITSASDPYIYDKTFSSWGGTKYDTNTYNTLKVSIAANSTSNITVFYATGYSGIANNLTYTAAQSFDFSIIADGTARDYYVDLPKGVTIYGLRFDFNGPIGDVVTVESVQFVNVQSSAPDLLLDRGLHTYADKMHQVLSIVAPNSDVTGIQEIGMVTKIAKNTVAAGGIVIQTAGGTYTSVSGTISNVEYAGFVINGAGVFGYILPADDKHSGTITITDDGTNYVITQTIVPTNGTISKQPYVNDANKSDLNNYKANDSTIGTSLNIYNSPSAFYFGQRIYTADVDTTDAAKVKAALNAFVDEAYIERNPLTAENIKIDMDKTPGATFDGYDAIRGMYAFTIPENIGFNQGYYYAQNFHGAVSFSVTGDNYNRNLYVMAYSSGCSIEGGAVLDANDQLLPIPTEVSKNFNHEFEEPIWLWGDIGYSEVRIPVYVNANETQELTVLQTYMNWGQYPLKQLSSIQFFAPYYHLSTGVTETNCIANYYVHGKDLDTLPDHRAMSGNWWANDDSESGDPQHDNGGYHNWLQYVDSNGNKVTSEPITSVINSAGLTYADIDMTYVSDDGKIQVTYKHMEMPQVDENRTYYTMTYTVLEDVTINDFYKNFSFYSAFGYGTGYTKLGYLADDGTSKIVNTKTNGTKYTLGKNCPYFDLFATTTGSTQNANVSFLIADYQFVIGGADVTNSTSFAVYEANGEANLSLDLSTVTLKKNDTITINAIVMPWGNENSANDQNVRDVRENTLLAPIVATPGDHAEAVTNKFLPTVKTTNGLDATVTIGHANAGSVALDNNDKINITFRVDGFKVLTTPKLYEFVNGGWKLVEISSANSADRSGSAHNYDGYAVFYDAATQTYSYSFVTTITGEEERSFKVVVDDTYVDWTERHGDLFFDANRLHGYASNGLDLSSVLSENGKYVTITNNNANDPHTESFKIVKGSAVRYVVIKYRLAQGTTASGMQFFMTTSGVLDGTADQFTLDNAVLKRNGQWQVMVIDLAAIVAEKSLTDMVPNAAGSYDLNSFRFDPFTTVSNDSIDIEYIAFCGDLHTAVELNSDMNLANISFIYNTTTSGPISDKLDEVDNYGDMDVIFAGSGLKTTIDTYGKTDNFTTEMVDGNVKFTKKNVSAANNGTTYEAYFRLPINTAGSANKVNTGKYLVIKYRTDSTRLSGTGIFASTSLNDATGDGDVAYGVPMSNKDGWHIMVYDLSRISAVVESNGKYTVNYVRIDAGTSLAAGESIEFAYIGLCDDLKDIPTETQRLEYAASFKNNVDWAYVDGDTNNKNVGATTLNGAEIYYHGWLGVANKSADSMVYVVTNARGDETIVPLTAADTGTNIYFEGSQDIQNAVASLGAGTKGYVVDFHADLSKWAGQTVTLSIREIVDGIATVETYSVKVTVPESSKPGYISGKELAESLVADSNSSDGVDVNFTSTLNSDGSVTITNVNNTNADGALRLEKHAAGLTPRYALVRYKTINHPADMIVLSTTGSNSIGGWQATKIVSDGEWHNLIVDLTKSSAGYTYGEVVSFLRLDICEGAVGYSMTIDYIQLFSDMSEIADNVAGELVDTQFANNVDFIYVDDDGETNHKGEASITATTVNYTGWLAVDDQSAYGISYVVTDSKGRETVVDLAYRDSGSNIYYIGSEGIQNAVTGTGWSSNTVGYGVKISADLSAWAGQTVTLSIREKIYGGIVIETYSVRVTVPAQTEPPVDPEPPVVDKELDVKFDAAQIAAQAHDNYGDGANYTVVDNGDGTATLTKTGEGSATFTILINAQGAEPVVTGKYIAIKYRINASAKVTNTLFYTGTETYWAVDDTQMVSSAVVNDGEWHVMVVDLSQAAAVTESNAGYTINFVRIDLGSKLGVGDTVDFEYIGFCDDIMDVDASTTIFGVVEMGQKFIVSYDGGTGKGDPIKSVNTNENIVFDITSKTFQCNGWLGTKFETNTIMYRIINGNNATSWITVEGGIWETGEPAVISAVENACGAGAVAKRFSIPEIDLSAYNGNTIKLCIALANVVDGDIVYATMIYEINITVPPMQKNTWGELNWVSVNDNLNAQISNQGNDNYTTTYNSDGTVSITKTASGEAYFTIVANHSYDANKTATGRYLVVKYRTTSTSLRCFGLFASTSADGAAGGTDNYYGVPAHNDGEWHIMVFDLKHVEAVTAVGSEYYVNFVRLDMGTNIAAGETIDYGYIGFCDDLSDIDASDTIFGVPEIAAQYQLSVDSVGSAGGTTAGLTGGNYNTDISREIGSVDKLTFVGWLGLDGYTFTNVAYKVVVNGKASGWTVIANSTNFEQGVHDAGVGSFGDDTYALRMKFGSKSATAPAISLAPYAGQTITIYLAATNVVNGEMESAVLFHEITISVPESAKTGYNSAEELKTGVLGAYSGTINDDGSLTVTNTAGATDGTIDLTSIIDCTAKYAIIRYKTMSDSKLTIYATTVGKSHSGVSANLKADGAWHVVVVDLECVSYTPGDAISLFRIDTCEGASGQSITFDYVILTDDISNVQYEAYDKLDASFVGAGLISMVTTGAWDHGIANATLNADGTVTITTDNSGDSYFGNTFNGTIATGNYLVVKYRSGEGANVSGGKFNALAASQGNSWSVGGHIPMGYAVADHNWHILVINFADLASVTAIDGVYYMTDWRIDLINQFVPGSSIDFAYIGFCDDLGDIILEEGEYLEYAWQSYYMSPDTVQMDGTKVSADGSEYKPNKDSCGASDRSFTYTGTEWNWASGWFAIDNQPATDLSICVTDENGVEHWTTVSFSTAAHANHTWYEVADITTHNINNNGFGANTVGYRVTNVGINLSEYAGQTVTLSLRVMTEAGHAVVIYSVFITVPAN